MRQTTTVLPSCATTPALSGTPVREGVLTGQLYLAGGSDNPFIYLYVLQVAVASVLLHDEENLTLAIGSRLFLFNQRYLWGDFAAAAVLSGLPITAVFLLAQRWIVSGLTAGGVKG